VCKRGASPVGVVPPFYVPHGLSCLVPQLATALDLLPIMIRRNVLLFLMALPLCVCVSSHPVHANTVNANSCAGTDVQNAINSAVSGDTVLVPGGSCTWSSKVTIPGSKGITLNGQGIATITGHLEVTANSAASTFITGFTWVSGGNCGVANAISIHTTFAPPSQTFRVYSNTFSENSNGTLFCVDGNGPGLFDHNTISIGSSGGATEVIHNLGVTAGGWTTDVTPGSSNMFFVEDNTFTFTPTGNPAFFQGTSAIQSYSGARTVVRHNNIHMMQVDQHGTCGMVYARWWEIYENTFFTDVANANQSNYMALRGGSGVAFNNHHQGTNLAPGVVELTEDCTTGTYPLSNQIGRGDSQDYSPVYIWGNDADMTVSSGNATDVQSGRDYFTSASQPASLVVCETAANKGTAEGGPGSCPGTYNYAPYTYPHPVTAGATPPAPPTNVKVSAH
jgi:hypothetical protein